MDTSQLHLNSFDDSLAAGDSSMNYHMEQYRKLNNDLKSIAASKRKLTSKQRLQPDYVSYRRSSAERHSDETHSPILNKDFSEYNVTKRSPSPEKQFSVPDLDNVVNTTQLSLELLKHNMQLNQ